MAESNEVLAAERVLGISRLFDQEDHCTVSHPDAGGKCENKALGTVYGLPFCAEHFGEARTGALAELGGSADDLLSAFAPSPELATIGHALATVVSTVGLHSFRSDYYDLQAEHAAKRAYPFREDLVAPETRAFERAPGNEHPTDHWNERVWIVRRFMRIALEAYNCSEELLEILEPLREQAVAQNSYAQILADRRGG